MAARLRIAPAAIPGGRLHTALVIAVALSGASCEPAETGSVQSAPLLTTVDSSGSYPVVTNSGVPPRWDVQPLGAVGRMASLDDPAPDEFGRISSVTTGTDDRAWVADQLNARIKVFRQDGSLALEIGREGQGPGEFVEIYSIGWVGDRLLVLDLGNGRIAELSDTGDWLGTRPAPGRVSGSPAMLRFYPLSDSTVVQWSLTTVGGRARRTWVEHGPEGVSREWQQLRVEPPEITTVRCDRPDGAISFFSVPFAGQQLSHPARGDRTYLAWSSSYRIALVAADGDTVRVIERSWPSVALDDSEWERATADFREFQAEWPGADCEPAGAMDRPDTKAAINNLLVDTEGHLWVEAVGEEGPVWEVFDPDGRLVGSIAGFDYNARVAPSIRNGRIAWSSTDSLDVEYVHWGHVPELSSF